MSKTIRQRIDAMHKADRLYHELDYAFSINHATEEETAALVAATQAADQLDDAIIADWNAAVEAMMAMVKQEQFPEPGYGWRCQHCQQVRCAGHQDTCLVGKLQAALARMEGHSHSRDEAMVEDKRYERDDIYKK